MICLEKLNKSLMNSIEQLSDNPFGLWLKGKREKKGWSVRKLAKESNNICSPSYISQLENNSYKGKKGKPMQANEEIVDALATALGEPINEARRLAGHAPSKVFDEELTADRLFDGYNELSEERRKIARKQIAGIIRGLQEEDSD